MNSSPTVFPFATDSNRILLTQIDLNGNRSVIRCTAAEAEEILSKHGGGFRFKSKFANEKLQTDRLVPFGEPCRSLRPNDLVNQNETNEMLVQSSLTPRQNHLVPPSDAGKSALSNVQAAPRVSNYTEAEELLCGNIKLNSRHHESEDEVINNVTNYLKLLDLTGRSVLTSSRGNVPATVRTSEDVMEVCENILSKVHIRKNINNPHKEPVNLNFGYLSNFLRAQNTDIITSIIDLTLKHNPITSLNKLFDTFNYYLFDKLLCGVVVKWSEQHESARCLNHDGEWTILMSKSEANYRTHMETTIILLVKMVEVFVMIESTLNAQRGFNDDRTTKNQKFRLIIAQMNYLYKGDFALCLEELDMVQDSLQISLIRTRDFKDTFADEDDYYAPLMNSTKIEESKRDAHYYDVPKLPSVSPISDVPVQAKEPEGHQVVLKEYAPLDKSFHLNALDDIDYYETASDDDEHIDSRKSFTELETIVDLSKKYKESCCDEYHQHRHGKNNDYVAIWNCQSGRVESDDKDYKPLKLECIKTSQSVTIDHPGETSFMKVESPPSSGTRYALRTNVRNEYDIDELGNESNNTNKKYLKNRYGLRSRNMEDESESEDESEKKYSLTHKALNSKNECSTATAEQEARPRRRASLRDETNHVPSQVVPSTSAVTPKSNTTPKSATIITPEMIDQARRLLFTKLNNNLNTLIKNTAARIKFMKAYNSLLKELSAGALDETIDRLFNFFNQELFFSILRDIQLEWSYRLKSTAATTVVVTNAKPSFILIRFSYNLLSKLSIQEVVKMLLHEMIHGFLGLAVGNLDEKHGKTYRTILKKMNEIFSMEIPIEHNYEEVFDLAHVWICNKCNEKRIRFYNVPPTEHQLEDHATKCTGKFLKTKNPD